jgi:Asp/Glu/hydantoin racemase
MKIGLVYTSTTPELIQDVEREVKTAIGGSLQPGETLELFSLQDPSILQQVRDAGYVSTAPAARLVANYMKAAEEGCDAILNICSSVGEVADASQDLAKYLGVPIVRIDEEMCREAVRRGTRIGVMATLKTTLEPTKNTVRRVAREMNRKITVTDILVDGAFGLDQKQFKERLQKAAEEIIDQVDVIVLAQGSMAYAEKDLTERFHKPVLGSPRFGAAALRAALVSKGLLKA